MEQARVHGHPRDIKGKELYGQQLEPGDVIQPNDVFDCNDGWQPCHPSMHGEPLLAGADIVIIRPQVSPGAALYTAVCRGEIPHV